MTSAYALRIVGQLAAPARAMMRRHARLSALIWNAQYRLGLWDYLDAAADGALTWSLIERYAPSPRILDLGCGTSANLPLPPGRYQRYHGVDISAAAIARARALGRPRTTFEVADIAGYQPAGRYDAILLREVLYYLDCTTVAEFLPGLARFLRADGKIFAEVWGGYAAGDLAGIIRNCGLQVVAERDKPAHGAPPGKIFVLAAAPPAGCGKTSDGEAVAMHELGRPADTGCDPQPPDRHGEARIQVSLTGVPETLLWNLCQRSVAASGRRPLLRDPKGLELTGKIDYPFADIAGRRSGWWHAVRVTKFDIAIRRFLASHPAGTVVALGEGLETQFWRVDNGTVRWLTVDLPETVELRTRLLPDGPRQRTLAQSATDLSWADSVDQGAAVLITAQGLLMYLELAEVGRLVDMCAHRFPGQTLLFDAVPPWMLASSRSAAPPPHMDRPPWRWAASRAERQWLASLPGVAELAELRPWPGLRLAPASLAPVARQLPGVRGLLPELPVFKVRLAGANPR